MRRSAIKQPYGLRTDLLCSASTISGAQLQQVNPTGKSVKPVRHSRKNIPLPAGSQPPTHRFQGPSESVTLCEDRAIATFKDICKSRIPG